MQTQEFTKSIDELIGLAKDSQVVIMCAEVLPWRCHRWLVSDALTIWGLKWIISCRSKTVRDTRLPDGRMSKIPRLLTRRVLPDSPLVGCRGRDLAQLFSMKCSGVKPYVEPQLPVIPIREIRFNGGRRALRLPKLRLRNRQLSVRVPVLRRE
jgi:hypothetical protein